MKKRPDEKDPREDLTSRRAVVKIAEIAKATRVCFFGTQAGNAPLVVRPMAVQEVDDEGNIWFLSGRSSAKNLQLERRPRVQLLFANTGDSAYLNLHGVATVSDDPALIKEYWTPIAKTWFHEGKQDPEATVIKVRVESGYYWDTVHGRVASLLGVAIGAITGKTLDDSVEGSVRPHVKRAAPRKRRTVAAKASRNPRAARTKATAARQRRK